MKELTPLADTKIPFLPDTFSGSVWLRSFPVSYGLFQIYNPILCPESAFRKLKHWIGLSPGLRDRLEALGGSSRLRTYTTAQMEQIVAALGES